MLNPKQAMFCNEYCVDFNATQAYIRAYGDVASAGQLGHELLKNVEIAKRIEARKEELAAAAELTPEWILKQWMRLACADPADLADVRRVNCRHCWGYDGQYQWTQAEYTSALNRAIDKGQPAPDGSGGFDFDPKCGPNSDCQECGGEGVEFVYVMATDKVKGTSRGLFAGVKQTKDGIEIKMRDQDAALKNLSAYLGMSIDRRELSGPGGKPIPLASVTAKDLTDDQLAGMLGISDEK